MNISNNNQNNVKVDVVSGNDIQFDENSYVMQQGEQSIDAIPDLDILTGHVYDILQYLEKPNTIKILKNNGEGIIKKILNEKYADSVPYPMLTLLIEEKNRYENVDMLLRLFENLNKAKRGNRTLEDIDKELTDEVNQKYIYDEYGGTKEAFEEQVRKEVLKSQKKKKKNKKNNQNPNKVQFNLSDIGKMTINE